MLSKIEQILRAAIRLPGDLWSMRRPEQTPLYLLGLLLIASGLFHTVIWLLSGTSWEGPVSWRKPVVFGLSGGITTLSLGWLAGYLKSRKSLTSLSWIYTVSMFIEVALITMQQWRGTGSHFNVATAFDRAVFIAMGSLITIASIVIAVLTVYSFRSIKAPADTALAIRGGLVLLNIANLLGMFLAAYGSYQTGANPGHAPNIFGEAGMLKVPHAIAIHGIQLLPAMSWFLKFFDETDRVRKIKTGLFGYSGILLFAIVQTFSGRAPMDVTPFSFILLAVSAITMLLPLKAVLGSGKDANVEVLES